MPLLLGNLFLFPLAKPVPKQIKVRPHDDGVLDKLLHAVHQPVPIRTRLETAAALGWVIGVGEVRPGVRD